MELYTGQAREALTPIEWIGDTLALVRSFSKPVRQKVGFELEMVQHGIEPTAWKPMPMVGSGVSEIRVHVEGEYRVFYVAKFQHAVYVLHAFAKRTRKSPRAAIGLARAPIRKRFEWRV